MKLNVCPTSHQRMTSLPFLTLENETKRIVNSKGVKSEQTDISCNLYLSPIVAPFLVRRNNKETNKQQ